MEFQELAITVVARNYNPTRINFDFLFASGIIPSDWELLRQPILAQEIAQISFQNGVNIIAQGGATTFSESISNKNPQEILVPTIARRYVEKLSAADYQFLRINPQTIYTLGSGENTAHKYIIENLLAPGLVRDGEEAPVSASINLVYQFERCQLSLSINSAQVKQEDSPAIPALLFSGNFNYNLTSETQNEKLSHLCQLIDGWQTDLENYKKIVDNKFIKNISIEKETNQKKPHNQDYFDVESLLTTKINAA